jgi:hypothetical protein
MRGAQTFSASGQNYREPSVIMTALDGLTGPFVRDDVFLTADRHSYFRYPEASDIGFTNCRPSPDWPVPAHLPDLP